MTEVDGVCEDISWSCQSKESILLSTFRIFPERLFTNEAAMMSG